MGSTWKLAAIVLGCLIAMWAPAPAAAAGWTTTQLGGEAGTMFLLNVSCPTTDFCVASGTQNLIAASTDPTGGAAAWHVVYPGTGPFGNGTGAQFPTNSQLQGISCPSSRLCVAVTNQGVIYTSTDPTGPASAWNVAELKPTGENIHLYGVSCPTEALCVAVSGRRVNQGKVFTSTNPTGGAAAWQEADLGEGFDLRAVSCSSPTLCVAAGAKGELVASRNPTGGAAAWSAVGTPGGAGVLQSIDCIAGLCLSGNSGGNLLTATEPTDPASWRGAAGGGSVQVTGSACASTSACLAVDNNGDVIVSTAPTGPSPAWRLTNVRPYSEGAEVPGSVDANGLFGAACPTAGLCVLVGSRGAILTSTEPFATPRAPAGTTGERTASRRRGPKRPRARIAHLRFRAASRGRGSKPRRAKLTMRFYANGPTRRFECRLDRRRFRRCRSPRRYRAVGRGIHSVAVRAVGPTGLRGRVARRRFYVGQVCRRRLCLAPAGVLPPGRGWKLSR